MIDCDKDQPCLVIPFVQPETGKEKITTSSIAAVIAVTVLHHEDESPESRLFDIIESSDEAEVIDVIDVLDQFDFMGRSEPFTDLAVNDNRKLSLT
jgi:hypothetical protein